MERSWVICDSFHLSSVWVHSLRDTPVTGDSQSFSPGHPAPRRPAFARVAPERYPLSTLHACTRAASARAHVFIGRSAATCHFRRGLREAPPQPCLGGWASHPAPHSCRSVTVMHLTLHGDGAARSRSRSQSWVSLLAPASVADRVATAAG